MAEIIIDFEGCLQGGIREIGIIKTQNLEIVDALDFPSLESSEINGILMEAFEEPPAFLIAHNVQTEKNLIREYMPYPAGKLESGKFRWGPWLDTLTAYRTLYPSLKDFSLGSLVSAFIEEKELRTLAEKMCEKGRNKPHCALFDALCTLLLTKRLSGLVDLKGFIK